jgi:putative hemolysin
LIELQIDSSSFSSHTSSVPNKKSYSPALVSGVAVMVAVFVITSVIGLTLLIIKRDMVPTFQATEPTLQLANPAAVNCIENHNGNVVEKLDDLGSSWSYCAIPDGKLCEVWELFRTQTCVAPTDWTAP